MYVHMYVDVPTCMYILTVYVCVRICVSGSAISCRYQTLSATFLTQSVIHTYIHVHIIFSAFECSKLLLCIRAHYIRMYVHCVSLCVCVLFVTTVESF